MTSGIRCTPTDIWTVAQTAYGEARGEGINGIEAVVWVIRNRHDIHPRWRGMPLVAICRAPMQFSCWNPGDPNRNLIGNLSLDDMVFVHCLVCAVEVLGCPGASPVGMSTHYYAQGSPVPMWAEGKVPSYTIEHHLFFEGIS